MALTQRDAQALTYLAKRIRQDTYGANEWDEAGIYAHIAKLIGQDLALSVERVTRHAADAEAKTPGAIGRPFVPDAPTPKRPHPVKAAEQCPAHPGQRRESCGGCAADERACDGTERPTPAWQAGDAKAGADACRVAMRAAGHASSGAVCAALFALTAYAPLWR